MVFEITERLSPIVGSLKMNFGGEVPQIEIQVSRPVLLFRFMPVTRKVSSVGDRECYFSSHPGFGHLGILFKPGFGHLDLKLKGSYLKGMSVRT